MRLRPRLWPFSHAHVLRLPPARRSDAAKRVAGADSHEDENHPDKRPRNAFELMTASRVCAVEVPQDPGDGARLDVKIKWRVLAWASARGAQFRSPHAREQFYNHTVKALQKLLTYLTDHHGNFSSRSCALPAAFASCAGLRKVERTKRTPRLDAAFLRKHVKRLESAVATVRPPQVCRKDVNGVIDACNKFLRGMAERRVRTDVNNARTAEPRPHEMRIEGVRAQRLIIPSKYRILQRCLDGLGHYVSVEVTDDKMRLRDDGQTLRSQRRNFYRGLVLPFHAMLCRIRVGGPHPDVVYIWKVPANVSQRDSGKEALLVARFEREAPRFLSRAQRRELYQRFAGLSIRGTQFTDLCRELCAVVRDASAEVQRRVNIQAEYVIASGDVVLQQEFKDANVRSSKYDPFWRAAQGLIDQLSVADERRHGASRMSHIVSIAAFRREVRKSLPSGTPAPSVEWLRLQFLPARAQHRSALKHTGRFQLVRRVQVRNEHLRSVDSLWVHALARNARQWVVMQRDAIMGAMAFSLGEVEATEVANAMIAYISVDDKANIPVSRVRVDSALVELLVALCD